jgi:hypothetical protein
MTWAAYLAAYFARRFATCAALVAQPQALIITHHSLFSRGINLLESRRGDLSDFLFVIFQ